MSFVFVALWAVGLSLGTCGAPTRLATLPPASTALESATPGDAALPTPAPSPAGEAGSPTPAEAAPTPSPGMQTPSPGLARVARQTYAMPAPEGARARLGKGRVMGFDVSSTGELLAVASTAGVFVYRAENLEELWQEASAAPVVEVAFSPDGQTLAAAMQDGGIRLWTASGGRFLRRLGIPLSPDDPPGLRLTRLAYSPDGGVLAAGTESGSIRLWDPQRGEALPSLEDTGAGAVGHLIFSPDGQALISASRSGGAITFWDPSIAQTVGQVEVGEGEILDLAAAPDGSRLAALAGSAGSQTVYLWDLAALPGSGAAARPALTLPAQGAGGLAFSPGGGTLAVGVQAEIRFWEAATGEAVGELAVGAGPNPIFTSQVAISPAGTRLFALLSDGQENGPLGVWELPGGDISLGREGDPLILEGFTFPVRRVAVSDSSARLAAGFAYSRAAGRVWELGAAGEGLRTLGEIASPMAGNSAAVTGLALSPDGERLAAGMEDGSVALYTLAESGLVYQDLLPGPGNFAVLDLAFSPAGDLLAAAYQKVNDSVLLWDLAGDAPPLSLPAFHASTLAFAPAGDLLAVGAGQGGSVSLWDPAGGEQALMLFGPSTGVQWVGFPSSGEELAAIFHNGEQLWWSSPSGITLGSFKFGEILPGASFSCAAASPDGSILAVGTQAGTIVLLDRQSGEILRSLSGHTGAVLDLVFAPGGGWLASGSQDGTVIVWENN